MFFYNFMELMRENVIHEEGNGPIRRVGDEDLELIGQTVPFVFVPKDELIHVEDDPLETPPDLPFKTCFFEMLDKPITVFDEKGGRSEIVGIWVHEDSPWAYRLLGVMREAGETRMSVFAVTRQGPKAHFIKIIKSLLARMNREEVGFHNPRKVFKLKATTGKRQVRISKVVYVSPKRQMTGAVGSLIARTINWSHRWTVRGHWRKLDPHRVGKDRDGNPISNFTWVRPHEKGPEAAPLVVKTRVVQNGEDRERH